MALRRAEDFNYTDEEKQENPEEAAHADDEIEGTHTHDVCVSVRSWRFWWYWTTCLTVLTGALGNVTTLVFVVKRFVTFDHFHIIVSYVDNGLVHSKTDLIWSIAGVAHKIQEFLWITRSGCTH